jgi:hypothetical protein
MTDIRYAKQNSGYAFNCTNRAKASDARNGWVYGKADRDEGRTSRRKALQNATDSHFA